MSEEPKTFENEYMIGLIKDDIIHATFKPNIAITLDAAKQMVADRLEHIGDIKMPLLLDISGLSFIDMEALNYFMSEEATRNITAGAICYSTQMAEFAANVFMGLKKPPIPTQLFQEKEFALRWLSNFK
jgi:hypothetical protein